MYAIEHANPDSANSGLFLSGSCGYNIVNNRITLNVGEISSQRDLGNTSGTLSLELWALRQPYQGGGFTGYALAGTLLGQLNGQHFMAPTSFALDYQEPPEGSWYLALMLREWDGTAYTTRDFVNFAVPLEVGARSFVERNANGNLINVSFTEYKKSSVVDACTGQLVTNEYSVITHSTKPAASGLVLQGNCGYIEQNGKMTVTVGEIANQRDFGNTSGTLALELWALNQAYHGGDFDGIALAGTGIGSLNGQYSLYNASYDLDFQEPPAGEWYLTLMLREWNGAGYETRDCISFAVPYTSKATVDSNRKPSTNIINISFADHKKTPASILEAAKPFSVVSSSAQPSINQATLVDLTTIKGMPRKTAENIIAEQPYRSFDALSNVKGVGPKLLNMLRELFTL